MNLFHPEQGVNSMTSPLMKTDPAYNFMSERYYHNENLHPCFEMFKDLRAKHNWRTKFKEDMERYGPDRRMVLEKGMDWTEQGIGNTGILFLLKYSNYS